MLHSAMVGPKVSSTLASTERIAGPDGVEAEMTFTKVGAHQLIIDHTGVPDVFRGQGVGLRLVSRAVEDARAAGKTIIPLCPFAAAQFRRHPEWADVLKK